MTHCAAVNVLNVEAVGAEVAVVCLLYRSNRIVLASSKTPDEECCKRPLSAGEWLERGGDRARD